MTFADDNLAFASGRLIQWALRPRAIPFNDPEYRELLDRYIDQPAFREAVRRFADGLGLAVLEANDRGLFLGPQDDSVFAVKASEFRGGRGSAEDRLLDGLVQVAIAATIYPRQQDLDEESIEAKPPIACEEVDETLRHLCAELKRRAGDLSDSPSDEIERGFQEAWRVYESRPSVRKTQQGALSQSSTQGLIRKHMQLLVEHGCFVVSQQGDRESYRPTLRYQIQVRELAATKLFQKVRQAQRGDAAPPGASVGTGVGDA